VATYRRPELLEALLPKLVDQVESVAVHNVDATVVIIDNDPLRSAEVVTRAWTEASGPGAHAVRYVHEPIPGISAARNRALDSAADSDLLVFIDDDERPAETWLRDLVDTYRQYDAAGVLGPVLPEYVQQLDPWIEAGGFFVRPRQETGSTREVGFTGNLLLDLHVVRRLGIRFDEEFGLSGGEDNLFTSLLTRGGGEIRWCDEAHVWDLVPPERATRRWVLTRRFRFGTSHSRVACRLSASAPERFALRLWLTLGGAIRVGVGLGRYSMGRVMGSDRHEARGLRTAAWGAGMTIGAWGYVHQEYKRPGG
jgi:GT2 family glycosyltransferase